MVWKAVVRDCRTASLYCQRSKFARASFIVAAEANDFVAAKRPQSAYRFGGSYHEKTHPHRIVRRSHSGTRKHGRQGVNLLDGGDFEISEIPEWTLQEFASGTGAILNTAELQPWSDMQPVNPTVLWLRAFEGGEDLLENGDHLTNAILSQSVPGVVGETYTFTGDSRWEANYAGGVDILTGGPLNGQAPPTRTNMELAFLTRVAV